MALQDDRAVGIWLYAHDGNQHTGEPVDYIDFSVTGGRYKNGDGTFTVPASSRLVDLFMGSTVGKEYLEAMLRVYYRDATTPLWTGMMGSARMSSVGDEGEVEIVFEQAMAHALRRRLLTYTGQAAKGYTSGTVAADNIALGIMDEAIGPNEVTPTGYTATRTDFGSFTFEVAAAHSPALSSSLPALEEQSGSTLIDLIPEFCEQEDLALICTDNGDYTFDIDTDYPYAEDVSSTVVFSSWLGNLVNFEAVSDLKSLANAWSVEGATVASHQWAFNTGSITARGVYEAHAVKPQDANNSPDALSSATWLSDRFGTGTLSYQAEIAETTGCLFNVDWGLRSTVRFNDTVHGYEFDQTCVGYELSASDGGPAELVATFGTPRLSSTDMALEFTGTRGPRMGGGRYRNKRL